jgi:DNA replication protein DnaC
METISRETEYAVGAIKTCPSPCSDRTVEIRVASRKPRRVPCPIASGNCHYGARLAAILNGFLIDLMLTAGVPVRHLDNIKGASASAAALAAESWQARGFLILTGMPGAGKSFAAARAVMRYLRTHIGDWFNRQSWENASKAAESVTWVTAKEIVDNKNLAARARSCRLAVLDDLGKEDETRVGMAAVRDVISKRYDIKSPTIITSELTLVNIQDRYGRYIAERLVEDYCSKIVDCGGESLRLKEDGGA